MRGAQLFLTFLIPLADLLACCASCNCLAGTRRDSQCYRQESKNVLIKPSSGTENDNTIQLVEACNSLSSLAWREHGHELLLLRHRGLVEPPVCVSSKENSCNPCVCEQ